MRTFSSGRFARYGHSPRGSLEPCHLICQEKTFALEEGTGSFLDLEKGDANKKKTDTQETQSTLSDDSLSVGDLDAPQQNHNPEVKNNFSISTQIRPPPASCPFNSDYSRKEHIFVFCAGLGLALNSGYINGACLSGLLTESGSRQSVSGFTGTYTASALALSEGDTDLFGFQVCMILSFVAGAAVAGMGTPTPKAWRIAPSFGPTFLLGGCLLVVALHSGRHRLGRTTPSTGFLSRRCRQRCAKRRLQHVLRKPDPNDPLDRHQH